MNWMAVLLFAPTLLIGILASWVFSRKINLPLKRMVTGLGQAEMELYQGSIAEFSAISNHLKGLRHERKIIKEWMDHTKPALTSYHYLAQFKNIALDTNASKELWVGEGAFMVIVYQLRYRHVPSRQLDALMTRATGKIKDMITRSSKNRFPYPIPFRWRASSFIHCVYTRKI